MTKTVQKSYQIKKINSDTAPSFQITRLGIVSRDYSCIFRNGKRDFSFYMRDVLNALDNEKCDSVMFALYSVIQCKEFSVLEVLNSIELRYIKSVLIEEFIEEYVEEKVNKPRKATRFVIYFFNNENWSEYEFNQKFGTTTGLPRNVICDFVNIEIPKRIIGNSCVLLCGETNIVKYHPKCDKKVHDDFGLLNQIPDSVNVILNPIHDRMTRFEMKLKRAFLSKNNRIVISVWNRGRKDKNGNTRDGDKAAWTIFKNETLMDISSLPNKFGLEIGIVDCN